MRIRFLGLGKEFGNFNPQQVSRNEWLENINTVRKEYDLQSIFAPSLGFSTRTVFLGEDDLSLTSWFIRTRDIADGGIVKKPKHAVAFFNADCPAFLIVNKKSGTLALLHCALQCISRPSGEKSIIAQALTNPELRSAHILRVAFGIGSCCYGLAHVPENAEGFPTHTIRRGPRKGLPAVNLSALIEKEVRVAGVSTCIDYEPECPACRGRSDNRKGVYHSNVWDGRHAGRNMILAWYE